MHMSQPIPIVGHVFRKEYIIDFCFIYIVASELLDIAIQSPSFKFL